MTLPRPGRAAGRCSAAAGPASSSSATCSSTGGPGSSSCRASSSRSSTCSRSASGSARSSARSPARTASRSPYAAFVAPALLASLGHERGDLRLARSTSSSSSATRRRTTRSWRRRSGSGDVALGEIGWALIRGTLYATAFLVVMLGWASSSRRGSSSRCRPRSSSGSPSRRSGWRPRPSCGRWQDFDLVQLVILPLFLFSATFYPIDTLPGAAPARRRAHAALPRRRPDPRPDDRGARARDSSSTSPTSRGWALAGLWVTSRRLERLLLK